MRFDTMGGPDMAPQTAQSGSRAEAGALPNEAHQDSVRGEAGTLSNTVHEARAPLAFLGHAQVFE